MSITLNVDEEWEQFMVSSNYNEDDDDEDELPYMAEPEGEYLSANLKNEFTTEAPKASDIYVSTKTIIAYLNTPIQLTKMFWNIPLISYYIPKSGVVKKQMKFNSTTQQEVELIQQQLTKENYYQENIITHINNPDGRIKFKDIRKISIGISKKDIMSYRSKKKSAFYNCFAIMLRIKVAETFKEFHVKIFNTGKVEIPGIQNEGTFRLILSNVISILQPYMEEKLDYKPDSEMTVLINSNFNCGYFINRESLYDILKFKYNIQAIYDPCSYPGIQCKFYYNPDIDIQTGCQISEENKDLYTNVKRVSFMIFRTGSVLIVGKCDENVLMVIYDYLTKILITEFKNINQKVSVSELISISSRDKSKKIRRKTIIFDSNV